MHNVIRSVKGLIQFNEPILSIRHHKSQYICIPPEENHTATSYFKVNILSHYFLFPPVQTLKLHHLPLVLGNILNTNILNVYALLFLMAL